MNLALEDLEEDQIEIKSKEFDELIEYISLDCEQEYCMLLDDLESDFGLSDLWEYDPNAITDKIKFQHKCLLFWANKVS